MASADRPFKRVRRMSTEDSEGTDDWTPESLTATHGSSNRLAQTGSNSNNTSRPRRAAAISASASLQRSPSPENSGKRTLRLTVKAPPSRLRQATGGYSIASERENPARRSRNKPIVETSEDEEDEEVDGVEEEDVEDDEEEEEEEEDDEDGGVELEDPEEEDEDEDEEDEEAEEDDEDTVMPDSINVGRPHIKISAPTAAQKPNPNRALKQGTLKMKSVEEKEMDTPSAGGDEEDEDLSELDSQDEEDEEDGAEADEDNDIIAASAIDEEDLDSDAETSTYDSRSGTPDLTKLTRRQRAHYEEQTGGLMALSNEAQKKKFFTAEQITMRRVEMARRRKDLSDKRNEEEKADTLQRLLHKPAPKKKSRLKLEHTVADEAMTPGSQEQEHPKPSAIYARTIINAEGTKVAVPEEWFGTPAGRLFEGASGALKKSTANGWGSGRKVEVLEETTIPEVEMEA